MDAVYFGERSEVGETEFRDVAKKAKRSHTTTTCEPPFTTFWADEECQSPIAWIFHDWNQEPPHEAQKRYFVVQEMDCKPTEIPSE